MQRNVVTSATSVKLLLKGGRGFGCSPSDEGGMLIKIFVTARCDLETTLFSSLRMSLPAQRLERGQSMPYLAGSMVEQEPHSELPDSTTVMELRMSNWNRIGQRGTTVASACMISIQAGTVTPKASHLRSRWLLI